MINKKAVFICGSGGSGKSTFSKKYFGDYTIIDMDIIYESLLIKNGLGLKIKDFSKDEREIASVLFEESKVLNDKRFMESISKGEDIVIDSIGRDFDVILEQRNYLEKNGYTTYMIMMYVELDECLKRVESRERVYTKNITIDSWYLSYSNLTLYKKEFGDRFMLAYNQHDTVDWKNKFEIFINKDRIKNIIL
jgi:predicted kinase